MELTEAMLNSQYGDYGKSFTMRESAELYARAHRGSYIYELFDYQYNDIMVSNNRVTVRDGAKKRSKGWLVQTMPDLRRRALSYN